MNYPDIPAALLLGALGSTHCVGMCGGISGALAFALGRDTGWVRRHLLLLSYSLGRISSYALMGAMLAGATGQMGGGTAQGLPVLRMIAALLLVLMGLSLTGWLNTLHLLERAGQGVWRRLQGAAVRLMPVDSFPKALLAGAIWGWLPCGLVYSALAWAGTSGSAADGAVLMLAFGLGTTPAVVASGALASQLRSLLQRRELRLIAGLLVIGFGLWTLAAVLPGSQGSHVHHHH